MDELTERMTAAIHRSVRRARAIHNALGLPMVVWRDGRVVYVDAATGVEVDWPDGKNEDERLRLPPRS